MARRCKYIHPSGRRCGGYAVSGSEYCFVHRALQDEDDATAGEADARSVPTLAPVRLRTIQDAQRLFEVFLNEYRLGRVDRGGLTAQTYTVLQFVRTVEATDLEGRLAALEERLVAVSEKE